MVHPDLWRFPPPTTQASSPQMPRRLPLRCPRRLPLRCPGPQALSGDMSSGLLLSSSQTQLSWIHATLILTVLQVMHCLCLSLTHTRARAHTHTHTHTD